MKQTKTMSAYLRKLLQDSPDREETKPVIIKVAFYIIINNNINQNIIIMMNRIRNYQNG